MTKWWNRVRHWASLDLTRAIDRANRDQRAMSYFLSLPPDKVVGFDYLGTPVRFHVPDGHSDNLQQTHMLDQMFFEQQELTWLAERIDLRGQSFIDVGANVGNHSVFWSVVCGASRGWAFEPLPHNFAILERNLALNTETVQAGRYAITAEPSRLTLENTSIRNLGGSSFRHSDSGSVEGRPLDSFEFTGIRLLKIDVEGMAASVLAGAKETIANSHPALMIEMASPEDVECRRVLGEMGYRQMKAFPYDTFLFER